VLAFIWQSDDAAYEIFLRIDIAEPVEISGVLEELVHAASNSSR
jgi:hypothetical protein